MATLFDLPEYKPYQDRWHTRLLEFQHRKAYYDGTAYEQWLNRLGWLRSRLYQNIRPLYLPLARAVDIDAGVVPAEWKLAEDAPAEWLTARDTVFDWSKWNTDGVLFVHYGAVYGVSGLKVSDLREIREVRIKPKDPTTFMLVENGAYSDTPLLALQIERRADAVGETYEYAEVITPDAILTYRDGQPFGYDERKSKYRNELGFVPYVEIDHIRTGEELGEATFQKTVPMLDELNEIGSYLADTIQKHSEPQWAVFGAEATDLEKSGDNVWFFSKEAARIEPIVPKIDIAGILAFAQEIRQQVEQSLPELSFDDIRQKQQVATATIELQLMELAIKIKRIRPNYDAGLIQALRMAGRAGASLGLNEIAVLDNEELAFDNDRPILPLNYLNMQTDAALGAKNERKMSNDRRTDTGGFNTANTAADTPGSGTDND